MSRALSRRLRLRAAALGVAIAGVASAAACATQEAEKTLLQAEDLVAPKDTKFEKDAVITFATFTDWQGVSVDDVQRFFHQTPYKRSCFLETYTSNGIRASDAIARAASTYKINPLVFLVRTQADQGLIGEQLYPSPPARVEYAFGCGCPGKGACDPAYAGFDRQVDCIGRAMRQSLDEMAQSEGHVTANGWGPGVTSRTLDGAEITPTDEGTAAVYQYNPILGAGTGGAWLFWVLFQKYAEKLDYSGPLGTVTPTQWIGDPCAADTDCAVDGATCQLDYPGGFCTKECSRTECPEAPGRVPTFCANINAAAACTAQCDPNVPSSCRPGYECKSTPAYAEGSPAKFVCVPQTTQ